MRPSRADILARRASTAASSAIAVYNQPHVPYREDALCILVVNAWELLLKAKIIKANGNRLDSVFAFEKGAAGGKRRALKRNRSGSGMTIGMTKCLDVVRQMPDGIDDVVRSNIEAILEIRDNSCHFMSYGEGISDRVYRIGAASLINFFKLYRRWFNHPLPSSEFPPLPLAFRTVTSARVDVESGKDVRNLVAFLDERIAHDTAGSEYAVAVDVDVSLSKKSGVNEIQVRLTTDPNAPEIRLSEQDFKARFPLDYHTLLKRLKKQVNGIKFNSRFNELMRELQADPNLCHVRLLDPGKPKAGKKQFYSEAILSRFATNEAQLRLFGNIEASDA